MESKLVWLKILKRLDTELQSCALGQLDVFEQRHIPTFDAGTFDGSPASIPGTKPVERRINKRTRIEPLVGAVRGSGVWIADLVRTRSGLYVRDHSYLDRGSRFRPDRCQRKCPSA